MAVLPENRVQQVEFCETHVPVWEVSPAAIGLTAPQVEALSTLTAEARTNYQQALAAREASKAATTAFYDATRLMREQAAMMIAAIKSFADQQADPLAVYVAAQIPPPSPPTPAVAPGKPNSIGVTLEPSGAITLSWDATEASASSGGFFNISRKLPGQSSFQPIGGAPGSTSQSRRMSFTDHSVPTSAAQTGAQYIITGRRGTLSGLPSDAITVQFGVEGAGFTVQGGTALKMAA